MMYPITVEYNLGSVEFYNRYQNVCTSILNMLILTSVVTVELGLRIYLKYKFYSLKRIFVYNNSILYKQKLKEFFFQTKAAAILIPILGTHFILMPIRPTPGTQV